MYTYLNCHILYDRNGLNIVHISFQFYDLLWFEFYSIAPFATSTRVDLLFDDFFFLSSFSTKLNACTFNIFHVYTKIFYILFFDALYSIRISNTKIQFVLSYCVLNDAGKVKRSATPFDIRNEIFTICATYSFALFDEYKNSTSSIRRFGSRNTVKKKNEKNFPSRQFVWENFIFHFDESKNFRIICINSSVSTTIQMFSVRRSNGCEYFLLEQQSQSIRIETALMLSAAEAENLYQIVV